HDNERHYKELGHRLVEARPYPLNLAGQTMKFEIFELRNDRGRRCVSLSWAGARSDPGTAETSSDSAIGCRSGTPTAIVCVRRPRGPASKRPRASKARWPRRRTRC